MRIAICTDAWHPQVNGVVRTLAATVDRLIAYGHEVELVTPSQFRTMPMPGYGEIRLAMLPRFGTRRTLSDFAPDVVHIATEGPIGWSARSWCKANGVPFTSAFHTRFPEYAAVRTGLSVNRFWPVMRRFHGPSRAVLVSTPSLADELAQQGIKQTRLWTRGIDRDLFVPGREPLPELADLPRPIMLNVGRAAIEKNLVAFLEADVPGTKVVVGSGPDLMRLQARFPEAVFLGARHGEDLARAYCSADVFVFPSRTDTFGLVMIEAMACGVPVAAFPVPGPLDVVGSQGRGPANDLPMQIGALDEDLSLAINKALRCDRLGAAVQGARYNWDRATEQFLAAVSQAIQPVREMEPA
ncbi:glycosyltransferase family 4 protein [Novosphingobium taihuense]|uniref:Glycosyltransferase involved in cell wall biosynthesis n=1 Tax=Novosphingobium taihuense TaxID=260085 RepID=A0A7W7ACG2_9SPHN|nr:glycosyltransferase family 1 protein [Novosphingobium taihuense]MBB4613617.1 glycosyltransferase involved in cell wall biosynthesis [Novosphingobium taihuense]TWH81140.1 glycosyltransferase involved in cell wall biosynthesis [Novosphingobium taihuense]